ncbi:MAG TPA: 3-methyl-2-oxobutanoate hydroxymethyltransferase, partial [Tepidisphaeraceae bacterium]|nr:3-methyl-2-oxobutanoate hydroxymethyltransferase [Tepidisphaeraceae bacterium]
MAKTRLNGSMTSSMPKKMTLDGFRAAMDAGRKLAMLTCYDFTTAKLLERAGIQLLLVGDSAANTILGYENTLPISQDFLIEITRAVRRGAPNSFVMADLPFGSFSTRSQGIRNAVKFIKETGADSIKIECTRGHLGLIQGLADAGVAVFAHLGLTPQRVGLIGGYKTQGKTAHDALMIADLAADLVNSGAAGILLETVPPQVSELICGHLDVPVIGCGAGP